jgi:hypothetical protein
VQAFGMNSSIKKAAVGAASQKLFLPESTSDHVVAGDNSAQSQRHRFLNALRKGPVTTLGARRMLDVMHPAARAQELREDGHDIITVWTHDFTSGRTILRLKVIATVSPNIYYANRTNARRICLGRPNKWRTHHA